MKLYITRHGQVNPESHRNSVDFPLGDIPLTSLGEAQAKRLGEKIKQLGFRGLIYSSPYRRTMQTASIIAAESGCKVIPHPGLREMFFTIEDAAAFKGMTLQRLKEEFKQIHNSVKISYPWWEVLVDDLTTVANRVNPLLGGVLNKNEDVMFVGHGATVVGAINYMIKRFKLDLPVDHGLSKLLSRVNLNCNLCCFSTEDNNLTKADLFSTQHLDDDMLTSNTNKMERPAVWTMPQGLAQKGV